MKVLAWDTSSKTGTLVALEYDPQVKAGWEAVRLVGEWSLNVDLTHSERLLWAIHSMLESARWKINEVDVFGVGVGPGSFTGLRIGVTTARTLAHTLERPLLRVSSLAALARSVAQPIHDFGVKKTWVIAATDACKGELFALWGLADSVTECVAMAEGDLPGLWKRGVEEKVLSPEELMSNLHKKLSDKKSKWIAVGEGVERYLGAWKVLPAKQKLLPSSNFHHQIQGRILGRLVWEGIQAGILAPALQVHPRYLRASDAELKLKAGLLPPGPTRGQA